MRDNYSLRARIGDTSKPFDTKQRADDFEKFKNKPISGVYGALESLKIGQIWTNKKDLREAGGHLSSSDVHCGPEGVYSLLLSQNVTQDLGYKLRYVGFYSYSKLNSSSSENLVNCLSKNLYSKLTIRVFRSHQLQSKFAPNKGIRYDGLYYLLNCSCFEQNTCYKVTFTLKRVKGQPPAIWATGPHHRILMQRFHPSSSIAWLCHMFQSLHDKFGLTLLGGSVLDHPFSQSTEGIVVCSLEGKTDKTGEFPFPIKDVRNSIIQHIRSVDLKQNLELKQKDIILLKAGSGTSDTKNISDICDYQLTFPISIGNLSSVRDEVVSYFDSVSLPAEEVNKLNSDESDLSSRNCPEEISKNDTSDKNPFRTLKTINNQPSLNFNVVQEEVTVPAPYPLVPMVSSPRHLPEGDLEAVEVCKEEVFTKEELNPSPVKETSPPNAPTNAEDNKDTVWTPKEGRTICIGDWPTAKLVDYMKDNRNPTCNCTDCKGNIPVIISNLISMITGQKTRSENNSKSDKGEECNSKTIEQEKEPTQDTASDVPPPVPSEGPSPETVEPSENSYSSEEDIAACDSGDSDIDPLEIEERQEFIRTADESPPNTFVESTQSSPHAAAESSELNNPPPLFFHQVTVRQRDVNDFLSSKKRSFDSLECIEALLEDIAKRTRTLSS